MQNIILKIASITIGILLLSYFRNFIKNNNNRNSPDHMKFENKIVVLSMRRLLLISVLALMMIFTSCGSGHDHEHSNHDHTSEAVVQDVNHSHDHDHPNVATLTEEQIKMVGIKLGKVEQKELTATIKANGLLTVPNSRKASITSLYGGVVQSISVQVGNHVRKGQVIATIANPQFIQLQEEFITLSSKITLAEQELKRQQELSTGNAGVMKNLQSAIADLNILKTRKASLAQQIKMMGINPAGITSAEMKSVLKVVSPINGVVSSVFARIGSYVDVQSPVAEIVDNEALHLDLRIFEKDLPLMRIGQIIHFTITNNPVSEYDAEIFSIGSAFENESKTIPVHATVKGNKSGLIDGMNITGIVSLTNVTSPAVPNEAIVEADGKFYVFVRTDQVPAIAQEHHHDHDHNDGHDHDHQPIKRTEDEPTIHFEKIEVVKGISNVGYTAVTFVKDIPVDAQIAVKGAFFINAKLTNTGAHEH